MNLYRVIKHHLPEFSRQFETMIVSRDDYEQYKQQPLELLTDVNRAVRYYCLLRNAYGGKIDKFDFTICPTRRLKLRTSDIEASLKAIHERLNNTVVENLNYDKCIAKYDREGTLFYIDPPYWNCESYYGKGLFDKSDFVKLAEQCKNIKGKCIISLNDTPEIRAIFEGYKIKEVSTQYSFGVINNNITEPVITNF